MTKYHFIKKLFDQLKKQLDDVRRRGWVALFRKLFAVSAIITLLPAIITLWPVVLIARLLRPIVLIRFGKLNNIRIGHFVENTELYLCERDAGLHLRRVFDVFHYYEGKTFCNYQLKKMWEQTNLLRIWSISRYLFIINSLLPGYKKHIIETSNRDIHGLYGRIPTHLSFTPEEEKKGNDGLREIGIPFEAKFICFLARESTYLNTIYKSGNYSYHNYRDSNIHNYIPAIEELVNRGYYAVRMGAVVKEPLGTSNPRIIDYAVKHRTEFMDIYLSAKCHFFLNGGAGMEAVSIIFRRPIARVNVVPIEYVPSWNEDLFISKKLWLKREHRFMAFREILESGVGRFLETKQYDRRGIEVIENMSEEIRSLAIEMDERLKGIWQTTKEDEALQRRFWEIFPTDAIDDQGRPLHGEIRARFGAHFLRNNRDWLK